MNNSALYEELDLAVEKILSGERLHSAELDPLVAELIPLADDLRCAPRPEFRARLLAELECPLPAEVVPIRPAVFSSMFAAQGYPVVRTNFAISSALHVAAIALLCTSGLWVATRPVVQSNQRLISTDVAPYLPPARTISGGGGGGGDRDKVEAPKGEAPRFAREQVTPPAIVLRNNAPKLAVEPTVIGPPDVKLARLTETGDPLSRVLGAPSNGVGIGGGVGSGVGGGVGSGIGVGVGPGTGGGVGGGVFRIGGGVSAPRALYDPDPEYTDEARKAKLQGVVLLWAIIGSDGVAHDVRVSRSLGMGLDQKAIEAVKKWKFNPARKDGQAVAVQINIEVNFHLY